MDQGFGRSGPAEPMIAGTRSSGRRKSRRPLPGKAAGGIAYPTFVVRERVAVGLYGQTIKGSEVVVSLRARHYNRLRGSARVVLVLLGSALQSDTGCWLSRM